MNNYSCGEYGASAYQGCEQAATTTTTGAGGHGLLANTGFDVIIPIAIGLAMVIASGILLVKQMKRRRAAHAQNTIPTKPE